MNHFRDKSGAEFRSRAFCVHIQMGIFLGLRLNQWQKPSIICNEKREKKLGTNQYVVHRSELKKSNQMKHTHTHHIHLDLHSKFRFSMNTIFMCN